MASTSHLQFSPTVHNVIPNTAFGAVNLDVNQVMSAGQIVTGPPRTFPQPGEAILFNVTAVGGYDFYIELQNAGVWYSDRPRKFLSRALAAGTDGFEFVPTTYNASNYRVVLIAKGASGSAVVASQVLKV